MTFLLFLTGLLLVATIAFFVALPLFTTETVWVSGQEASHELAHWEKQKTDAYTAIKEAEFDLQMGKLTSEDYHALREKYETRALEALAQLDALTKGPSKTDTPEKEVSASKV